ncbi:hypothetical protein L2E82_10755 [Cichorium intybus]|uniref:Uncharacterized protein n=1 Tax=Cichorium intybus TaxID=13427 RepID=A0ACB9GBH5_CICIN|nr:hypothetical protein L2E82_10755 [Cichorium intybus]
MSMQTTQRDIPKVDDAQKVLKIHTFRSKMQKRIYEIYGPLECHRGVSYKLKNSCPPCGMPPSMEADNVEYEVIHHLVLQVSV